VTSILFRGCLIAPCCLLVWSLRMGAQAPACSQPLPERQKQALTNYVRKKYNLPGKLALSLHKDTPVRDTCFRELTFEGAGASDLFHLTLYASPDGRFLSTDLFDTAIDPVIEQRAKDEALMKGLTQDARATRGPQKAAVTIVEFSDFECPFCRNFASILNEALAGGEDDVRVVFRHMPLYMHPWARAAAEMAACAQLQSNETFWSLHDRIFQNQAAITAENAKEKLTGFAQSSKGADAAALQKCVDTGTSAGLVQKDLGLAEANHINATPTLFINGRRLQGVESAARLRELIAEARKEVARAPASVATVP
jgi:protein-disulfide isomerase